MRYWATVLFTIHNDFPVSMNKTKPRLFADDTDIATGEYLSDPEDAANSDFENLRKGLTCT